MALNGIDISNWQAGIDLSAVPCDFVIQNPKPHLPDELRDSVGLVHIKYGGSDETPR